MPASVTARNSPTAEKAVLAVLLAISFSHLLNDTIQSLIPAIYPIVKESFHLSFSQVGLITLTFQMTASILQPLVGLYTDRSPKPFSLAMGMVSTLIGLVLLAMADSYPLLLVAVGFVGFGSAVFHPEGSRVAHLASGGKRGFAQSLFQVGGNTGSSLGPLLAAALLAENGRARILWFALLALLAILILWRIGRWYQNHIHERKIRNRDLEGHSSQNRPRRMILLALTILILLIFSKYFYLTSLTSYYTFYLITKFHISVAASQFYLFIFLFSIAAGTIIGGPLGDRFGRKRVIWGSILGTAPFAFALPYLNLFWTALMTIFIGLILASAFSAILVYAQELLPGRVGMISGLFFGFAFGMAGIGSALLGKLADRTGIVYVFHICSFLPLLGLLTAFLPDLRESARGDQA